MTEDKEISWKEQLAQEEKKEKEAHKKVLDALTGLTYSQAKLVLMWADESIGKSIFLGVR